ncbi:MAG: hypothetical protein IJZ16_10260 [Clostridia bacterium]|nr:hypothetical protein [Clostridia bacterium]
MQLANKEIRNRAKAAGVRFWQISKEIGVSEATLTRMLREELPENEANRLKTVIDRIGGESCVKV